MIELSLWEKINAVYHLVLESPLFLILLLGCSLMLIDALYISKTSKQTKITYGLISLAVMGLLIYSYFESVVDIVDAVAKNIVTLIYFPSVLEYMMMLIISLIILIFSAFSSKMKLAVKRINLLVFVINLFLFFLIVDQIYQHDVDLSDRVSIYINTNLMVLLELSLIIFMLWIVGLILYKIITILIIKSEKASQEVEITLPKLKTASKNNFYEEPTLPPSLKELRQQALMAEPKVVYVEKEKDEEMFTLEEYKEMRELLDIIKRNKEKK